MDKLDMQSKNLVDENISKIAELFPNCITEGKDENGQVVRLVDFDLLKQELSKEIVEGNDERYTLNWAGKKQAILTANSPINATLRPCREESVDFDNTKNLYIEGDNLDVLKLLRETYLGKVKMIYIDPPYNTGNDFVYEDDFATSTEDYLQASKSYDEQGNRMFQNNESNGRFHSDWLSMMYSRLKLAKDLLTDDGAIFISIDDNEQANLKRISDEIFGSMCFVATFPWRKRTAKSDVPFGVSQDYEWVLCYAKSLNFKASVEGKERKYYETPDFPGRPWRIHDMTKQTTASERPNSFFTMINPKNGQEFPCDPNRTWRITKDTFQIYYDANEIIFPGDYDFLKISKPVARYFKDKDMLKDGEDFGRVALSTKFPDDIGMSQDGTKEIKEIFTNIPFSFPKTVKLIKYIISAVTKDNDIVLDFFSGSATTAHAVMQLNAEDGGNRKFIMVQLPEKCDEKSEAYKAGYKNICEIGKERIRRAGKKIKEDRNIKIGIDKTKLMQRSINEYGTFDDKYALKIDSPNEEYLDNLDIGFRVLKLDSSNMKDVYYNPSDLKQSNLFDLTSNIKEDRSAEDLLFQVMLDMGVLLSSDIKVENIAGKKVFNVNEGNLVCCFDENLTDDVVTQIAKMQPLYAVFRDSSMSSDSVAVNFDQIFETYSPTTTRKVL